MRPRAVPMWRLSATALLAQIRVGSLIVVEDGRRRTFGSGTPAALINVNRPDFWRMLMRGSRGLAESYAAGAWDSPDLVAVIRLAARNAVLIDRVRAYRLRSGPPVSASGPCSTAAPASAADATSPSTTTSATSSSPACSIRP